LRGRPRRRPEDFLAVLAFRVERFAPALFGGRPLRFGAVLVADTAPVTALRRPRRGARPPAIKSDRCCAQ